MIPFFQNTRVSTAMIVAFLPLFFASKAAVSQEPGDRIVVAATVDSKIEKKVVGKVFEGSVHRLKKTNDNWCSLENVRGWIPRRNIMTLSDGIVHFSKRIQDNDKDPIALAHRGTIFYETQQYQRAYTDLHRSLALDNQNPVTWMLRGLILKEQGKFADAANDLKVAIGLNPKLANAYFNLGLVQYSMNDFENAIHTFDDALNLIPKSPQWLVARGSAKLGAGNHSGAGVDYRAAISIASLDAIGEIANAHIGLSNVALIDADFTLAQKEARLALKFQPENGLAFNALGWALFKQHETEDAIVALTKAIRFSPQFSLAYGNRGICHVELKQYQEAIADHTKHLRLAPKSPFAFSNRAVALMGAGEYANALSDFEEAEKIAPRLDSTLNAFAWLLATCPDETFRDGNLAVKKATLACELAENNDWYMLDTLASAHAENQDFESAVQWAKKALAAAPESKKEECQKQIDRFKNHKPFRSTAGKNAQ